jgi:hypothetical protein
MVAGSTSRPRWSCRMQAASGRASGGRPRLRLPEPAAAQRLAAVDVAALDVDAHGQARAAAADRGGVEDPGVGREGGPAVQPQRLLQPRHHEQDADLGLRHEVGVRVDPVVAGEVAEGEAVVVEHGHEPGRPARGDASVPWGPEVASTRNVVWARKSRAPRSRCPTSFSTATVFGSRYRARRAAASVIAASKGTPTIFAPVLVDRRLRRPPPAPRQPTPPASRQPTPPRPRQPTPPAGGRLAAATPTARGHRRGSR